MKLIMEGWRRWLGLKVKKNDLFPADGMEPISPKAYDVHDGGGDSQMPLLNPVGAPIKDRPALAIDHPKGAPSYWSVDKLDRDQQDFKKSDRNLRDMEARGQALEDLQDKWNVQNRELTYLEGAPTISKKELETEKERLESFRKVLAHVDTGDIDLYHMKKELNDIEGSIRALKTRDKK